MSAETSGTSISKGMLWAGRVLTALVVLFMLFDAFGHFMMPAPVVQAFNRLGFPLNLAPGLGFLELVCVVVYVIPSVSILGAILLTGYLGGAVAINLRVGDPIFETLFPAIFGVLVWGGIWFREGRLRALMPLKR